MEKLLKKNNLAVDKASLAKIKTSINLFKTRQSTAKFKRKLEELEMVRDYIIDNL